MSKYRIAYVVLNGCVCSVTGILLMSLADCGLHGRYRYLPWFLDSSFPYSHAGSFFVLTLVAYYLVYPKLAANVKPLKAVGHAAFVSYALIVAYGMGSSIFLWSGGNILVISESSISQLASFSCIGFALAIGAIILSPIFLLNLILPHLPLHR